MANGWYLILLLLVEGQGVILNASAEAAVGLPATQTSGSTPGPLRPSVHARRNVEDFPPVLAKFLRFRVQKTNRDQPCLDELEIYRQGDPERNVARSSAGARATASGSLPGVRIHQLEFVNDGCYGNGHSWIADTVNAWVQIELPEVECINRVVWGRDREGNFIDRLSTEYVIEVSTDGATWHTVASSADRAPLTAGNTFAGINPMRRYIVTRFAPVNTTLSEEFDRSSTDYCVDRWQTEDGLPGNTVTSIVQTHDGYLWIGTFGGLARFDGMQFRHFGEREGLKTNRILCLFEDARGDLWVGSEGGGLFRYHAGVFSALTTRDGLLHDVVMSLTEDALGRLWIGTYSGLQCWKDGAFIPAAIEPAPLQGPVSRLLADPSGVLWMVINGLLGKVETNCFMLPKVEGEPSGQMAVSALHMSHSGRLWIGGNSGYVVSSSHGALDLLPLVLEQLTDNLWDLCEARNGDMWIGTASSGLRRWRGGQVLSITTQEGLADNSVRCILEDREGNLWVGTNGGGLHRLKLKKLALVTTRLGLAHNVVMSLAEDAKGDVWIGSNGGGVSLRRQGTFAPAYLNYLLDNECIWSLLAARDGTLWIGTWNSGLFHKTDAKLERFNVALQDRDEPVVALCEDRIGGLWIGTYQDGLKYFQDGNFISYRATNGLSANFISALAQDPSGRLWIGTVGGGLNCLEQGAFKVFTRQDGLGSEFIRTIYADAQGVLWIGTAGGLSRLKDGRLATLTTQHGLADDVISQIIEDDYGHLWLGCNRGIFSVPKADLNQVAEGRLNSCKVLSYGKAEGMESLECTGGFSPAGLKTRDGKLWFSTVKGLVRVDPERLPSNELPPPVLIEQVVVDGMAVAADSLRLLPHIQDPTPQTKPGPSRPAPAAWRIGPGARHVELHYTALSFTAPEKVRFRYRLEGFDPSWVEAGTQRIAYYTYLPPGRYQFRVAACNNDGVWNDTGAAIVLQSLPLFWQTWWFRLLLASAVLGGTGWAVKYWSTRRLRRRLEWLRQQNALEQERTRIARDIHDELGTHLTEIALLSELGQIHRQSPRVVAEDLRRISDRAREAVTSADAIVWTVNPRNDSLDHLANYIVRFTEDFFHLTSIRCRLDVPAALPHFICSTQYRRHLCLAVKEVCNNVVRHAGATEVWLRMALQDRQFRIVIEDNGKGFSGAIMPEGSDGLRNLHQRMNELRGRLEIASQLGKGTAVSLITPLEQTGGSAAGPDAGREPGRVFPELNRTKSFSRGLKCGS